MVKKAPPGSLIPSSFLECSEDSWSAQEKGHQTPLAFLEAWRRSGQAN